MHHRITLDDGGKPFESGSAFDGTARTLAYCAGQPNPGWTNAKTTCSTPSATQPATSAAPLPRALQFLVGDWGGRYRNLTVNPDGTGELSLGKEDSEDYTLLGIEVILAQGQPAARITRSNNPKIPIGGRITIKRTPNPGMLEITVPGSSWGAASMCNPMTA